VPSEVLAEIVRSDLVEGVHRGSAVGLAADGSVAFAVGDPWRTMYPRSANKPLQAVGMLRCGLDLDGELLALACASHSGEEFHLDGVRHLLASAGLSEDALQTPPDWPVDDLARLGYARRGLDPAPIAMNCSGKHAAMLATCVANGWSTATYRDPGHPLQRAIRDTVEELAGEAVPHVGVDGCGAPLFAVSLAGLARAFHAVVTAPPGSSERRVADAVARYPEWVSGTTRDEARVMRALPGLVHKAGAEAVQAGALPDGRAYAVKADDGHPRVRPVLAAAALRRLGADHPVLDEVGVVALRGGTAEVGVVRALF
jgi:L-asparaginase II